MPRKKSKFAQRLRQLRADLGSPGKPLTQVEAAERAGVSARAWIAWENDQRSPGRITMRMLKATFPDHF